MDELNKSLHNYYKFWGNKGIKQIEMSACIVYNAKKKYKQTK